VMPSSALQIGEGFEVPVVLRNNPGTVKGMHFVVSYDRSRLEFVGVDQGEQLKEASHPLFFDGRDRDGTVDVSLALLGGETAIGGSGEIATIRFRLLQSADVSLGFDLVDLRDSKNQRLSADQGDMEYEVTPLVPTAYSLSQNHPNPFNLSTEIAFELPEASVVSLRIYNIQGQLVRSLVSEPRSAGYHSVAWDGRTDAGNVVSSGMYLYRLVSGDYSSTRKMILLK
jgi:hypothetical protein